MELNHYLKLTISTYFSFNKRLDFDIGMKSNQFVISSFTKTKALDFSFEKNVEKMLLSCIVAIEKLPPIKSEHRRQGPVYTAWSQR
jgi:hypothetical protein